MIKKFENTFKGIYPVALELTKENANFNVETLLGLNITTKEGQFSTKLYDKRDVFDIPVVALQYNIVTSPLKFFTQPFSWELGKLQSKIFLRYFL